VDAVVQRSSSTVHPQQCRNQSVKCIALDCDTNHGQVVIEELFTDINNVLVVIKDHHATPSWIHGLVVIKGLNSKLWKNGMVWCHDMLCLGLWSCGIEEVRDVAWHALRWIVKLKWQQLLYRSSYYISKVVVTTTTNTNKVYKTTSVSISSLLIK